MPTATSVLLQWLWNEWWLDPQGPVILQERESDWDFALVGGSGMATREAIPLCS